MDGDVSGAIMTGSGTAPGFQNSASPVNYAPPAGFLPPAQAPSGGEAPYTVTSGSTLVDNSASRMNMAKQAIASILASGLSLADIGLEDYATSDAQLTDTWVYYMSTSGGFTFDATAVANTVANPCFNAANNAGSRLYNQACQALQGLYGSAVLNSPYLGIGQTSDAPDINDVLYAAPGSVYPVFSVNGGPYPNSPYPPDFSMQDYENGFVSTTYSSTTPGGFGITFTPTNAGYVPHSPQVLMAQRGFGFNASVSATSGTIVLPLQTAGLAPTPAAVVSAEAPFLPYLAPETSSLRTSELKALAGQSPIAGLLAKADDYLSSTSNSACAGQYVVLLTDGLPTMDRQGLQYPPLGTASANAYGFTATFNASGALQTTNDGALSDAMTAIAKLRSNGVQVFVVGLGAGVDSAYNPVAAQTLQAMAIAGGTGTAYSAANQTQLDSALAGILAQVAQATGQAPVAPAAVSANALVYQLTTDAASPSGHAKAYATNAAGVPSTQASWDAATLMTAGGRASNLLSATSAGAVLPLGQIPASEFQLNPTPCVPDVVTEVDYTINPSYTWTNPQGTQCGYLAGRTPGSFLGGFSAQDSALALGAPSNVALLGTAGYLAYAQSIATTRPPMLLFSSNDGFLYAVRGDTSAQGGRLLWGWMPPPALPSVQNYAGLQSQEWMNGGVTVADAPNSSGAWSTYVVGTAQAGAYHYALQLDATGRPTQLTWSSAGTGALGTQAPLVVRLATGAYAVYVEQRSAGPTLVEQPLSGGAPTTAVLPFTPSGTLSYDSQSGSLWVGTSDGQVEQLSLSGSAASDITTAFSVGSTGDRLPVLYTGFTVVKGSPYLWAADTSGLYVFTIVNGKWAELWATGGPSGPTSGAQGLPSGAIVTGAPRLAGGVLTLPVYTSPGAGVCSVGGGEIMFFNLLTGGFPPNQVKAPNGQYLTGNYSVGQGDPYAVTVSEGPSGLNIYAGARYSVLPPAPLSVTAAGTSQAVGWRVF